MFTVGESLALPLGVILRSGSLRWKLPELCSTRGSGGRCFTEDCCGARCACARGDWDALYGSDAAGDELPPATTRLSEEYYQINC